MEKAQDQKAKLTGNASKVTAKQGASEQQELPTLLTGVSSLTSFMNMQRTIGNQALQRQLVQQNALGGSIQRMKYDKGRFDRFVTSIIKSKAKGDTFGTGKDRRKVNESSADIMNDDATKDKFSGVEDVQVPNGNHTLSGRFYKGVKGSKKGKFEGQTILFLSGSGGSAESYSLPIAQYYCPLGANLLAVNYRGFGGSESVNDKGKKKNVTRDDFTDETFASDAMAIFNWCSINKETNPGAIVLLGYSLGGPVATRLAVDLAKQGIGFGGLILHSSMDSIRETAVRQAGTYAGNVGADAVGAIMDTKALLTQLSQITGYGDLPLMVMSGSGENEHLDIDETKLDTFAQSLGFSSVFSGSGPGDHTESDQHFHKPSLRNKLDQFMTIAAGNA